MLKEFFLLAMIVLIVSSEIVPPPQDFGSQEGSAEGGSPYPLYKQCNKKWSKDIMGTKTICKAGCAISSLSMAIKDQDPGKLNTWLKSNNGYSGDSVRWDVVNSLGITYVGKVDKSKVKGELDNGRIVILNVRKGGHWVLAYSYSGDNIKVNDPGYNKTEYPLSEVVQAAVYKK